MSNIFLSTVHCSLHERERKGPNRRREKNAPRKRAEEVVSGLEGSARATAFAAGIVGLEPEGGKGKAKWVPKALAGAVVVMGLAAKMAIAITTNGFPTVTAGAASPEAIIGTEWVGLCLVTLI
jgi:hypothetical protein